MRTRSRSAVREARNRILKSTAFEQIKCSVCMTSMSAQAASPASFTQACDWGSGPESQATTSSPPERGLRRLTMSARFTRSARCLIGVLCNERLFTGSRLSQGGVLGDEGKDLELRVGVVGEGAAAVEVEAMMMMV